MYEEADLYARLMEHRDHDIELVTYGGDLNVALECNSCCCVIISADKVGWCSNRGCQNRVEFADDDLCPWCREQVECPHEETDLYPDPDDTAASMRHCPACGKTWRV